MQTYTRKLKTASNKNLDVYDFKDEAGSEIALRIKSKLENPKSAIDKYTFLATAAAGKSISGEEINYIPSLDIDATNRNHVAITLLEDSSAEKMIDSNDASTAAEHCPESGPELRTDLSESEVNVVTTSASPTNNKFDSATVDLASILPEHNEAVEMDPDESESMSERSSSSNDVAEDDNGDEAGPSSAHSLGEWEVDYEDTEAVVFYPEHMVYCDSCYTDSVISFTSSFIEMEGSTADEDEKIFKCKWGIEDIIHIESHWYARVEMAMVKIHLLAKDTIQNENVKCTKGSELKFAVYGYTWFEQLEAIASLNVTYKALWTNMLESEGPVLGHNGESFSKYLPTFDRPFEEVIYPKGDPDAVSISKRDFDLLLPDTFVNDTIIDFYIKYLKNKIEPEEMHRFHFFNSFFFRKLADPDKDPPDASKGRAAFQRVKKWTRKVNLFEKDYVFIPVNYNYHWSVLVFCHLGDLATFEDEDVCELMKVPCVLHMDSIRGSHAGLKGFVQSYLKEEWKERQKEASKDISSRFDNLRFISLELPQQQNSYDCGLFLLHYVELFLEQAPLHFNPFKITKNSSFLNVDWFPPAEASLKRVVIQKLICDLLEYPYQESCSKAGNENICPTTTNVNEGSVVNLPPEDCNPHQDSHAHDDIKISLIPSSSIQCGDDASVAFQGTCFPAFNHTTTCEDYNCSLTPIQQLDMEGGGQFVYSQTEQDNGIIPKEFRNEEAWVLTENNNIKLLQETSVSGCEDSVKLVNEISRLDSEVSLKKTEEHIEMVDGDDDHTPWEGGGLSIGFSSGVTGSDNSSGLEADVQQFTKKIRMTEP